MSQHDENPSVEPAPVDEQAAETTPEQEEHVETPAVEDAETQAPSEIEEDELFLAPDEDGGEVIEDVPNLANVQAELDAARAQTAALVADLEAMTAERDDFKSRLLRSAADGENLRKRKDRERDELRKYGADKVVGDLLPAIDNLERALDHAEKSEEESAIADGVKMVHRQLITQLEKHGIKSFTAVGERFDPQLHEAIQQVETTEFETGVVVQEFQKGYYIHDRLLRPSMTVVAKNVAPVVEEPVEESVEDEGVEQVIDMGAQKLEEGSEANS